MSHGVPMALAVNLPASVREREISVERLVSGDRGEFDRLVCLQQERVARLASRLLGWPADVGDVVQDVFVAALSGLGKFQGNSSVETWLIRITINTCRSYRRRRLFRFRIWERLRAEARPAGSPPSFAGIVDDERNARVRQAVAALPARYREVVVLRYLEEMSIPDVGDLLGLTRNAVEVRLNRSRSKLRQGLAELVKD